MRNKDTNLLTRRNPQIIAVILALLLGAGCARRALVKPPIVQPPPPVQASPVVGVWENSVRGTSRGRMIFKPGGLLTFEGGMNYFNPGQWELDTARHELRITLPQAEDEKLQIFKLYVGDGVKAFDRKQKLVTYAFDDQTAALNVGGWMFTKADHSTVQTAPEPTLH